MSDDREQRILDAAAELIAHYGYNKTTVSDIAREAGISKGAIYLHFDSKDALFERLLRREMIAYSENWMQRIKDDPEGGTMGGIYKNILYALNDSLFMSALFKRDQHVLGNYLRQPDNMLRVQGTGLRREFIAMLQDAGAVREDVKPTLIAHIMNLIAYGLVGIDEVIDDDDIPPLGDTLEAIGEFMDRALTPADGGNPQAVKEIILQITERAQTQLKEQEKPERDEN